VDVAQKVPLNMDRDNVSPGYLQLVRTLVLNHTHSLINPEDASSAWVRAANADDRCDSAAVERTMLLRFGEKRVSYDPADPEANKIATAAGYTVVTRGAMSAAEWRNVRRTVAIQPAGQVTPSPKPYSEGGRPEKVIPENERTAGMRRVTQFAHQLAMQLMGVSIAIQIVREPQVFWAANYGGRSLCLNVGRLGNRWFDEFPSQLEPVIDLLIHEFGHEYESDHLSRGYYKALTLLAARAVRLALDSPQFFRREETEPPSL
jgi:hypothetical protein